MRKTIQFLVLLFFILILVFRKNISQVTFGPLYFIEFVHVIIIIPFILYLFLNKLYINKTFYKLFFSIIIFFLFGFARFLIDPGSIQHFIPFFYPLYIILYILLFFNLFHVDSKNDTNSFEKKVIFFLMIFLFTPIILFGSGIIGAGNTLIYSICFFSIILFLRNTIIQFILVGLFFVSFFLSLERAILVNTFIPLLIYLNIILKTNKKQILRLAYFSIPVLILLVVYFDQIAQLATSQLDLRFEINKENIIGFVKTIWSSDVEFNEGGAIGSRNHRIEMWLEVVKETSKSTSGILFGDGFSGKIVDNEFAGIPHNGFITIFKRTGLVGIFLFSFLLLKIFESIKPLKLISLKKYLFLNLIFFAFILEMMTGTVIDSPFTAIIIYMLFAYGISLGRMNKNSVKFE